MTEQCISMKKKYGASTLLVFRRKDLCEAIPKTPSVFKFSDVLFALKTDGPPPVETSGGKEQY